MGYVLSPRGVAMDPKKVQAILDWTPPRNAKDIQTLIGFANFYRRFIHGFSTLTAPLTELLKKGRKFVWGSDQEQSFRALQKAFTTAPVLRQADVNQPFQVEADTSNVAVGVVLSLKQTNGRYHPIAYHSRKLTEAERNYTIWEKELLAIRDAFLEWRHYLEGSKHTILTLQSGGWRRRRKASIKRLRSREEVLAMVPVGFGSVQ